MEKFLIKVFQWIFNIPHDKMLHVLCGILLFLFFASPLLAITDMKLLSLLVGYFVVLVIGHLKEWFDCKGNWIPTIFPISLPPSQVVLSLHSQYSCYGQDFD